MTSTLEQQSTAHDGRPSSLKSPYTPVLTLVWERRLLLGKAAAIGLVLATIIAFLIPKEYKSTVQLMPPDPQSLSNALALAAGTTTPAALSSGVTAGLMGGRSPAGHFLGILNSRTVQDDLIDRFDLRRVYQLKLYADARKRLHEHTSIDEDKKTGNIIITVVDRDPYRARDLAAAYVEELDRLVAKVSTSSARRERIFLEERLKSVKEGLDAASLELGQFSSRNATFDVQTQQRSMLESAAKLQGELTVAESELRGLEAIYSNDNVRVRSLRARTEELRRQLGKLSGTSNENNAELGSGQLYPSVRKLPMLSATYSDLTRRAKMQEALFEILTKQYEISKVQEAKEIPTVKVLDSADLAEKKSFPPRLLIMVAGMLFAVASTAAWVVAINLWQELDEHNPGKHFVLEVLSTLKPRWLRNLAASK